MGNFSDDRFVTAIKIVFSIFIAVLVAVVCIGLIIMFFSIDFLPFWVIITVQFLCCIMIFADIKITLNYLKNTLEN